MDRISDLPRDILQRILYFLAQEEAVRTSVLSKSWHYIWCTRPNLVFSDHFFKGNIQEFLSVVENNLQRYCDQRVCVEEFHLGNSQAHLDHDWVSLLEKWIPILTTTIMGLKKFRLSFRSEQSSGLIYLPFLVLPSVIFEAEKHQDLHVELLRLDKRAIEWVVLSKHLKKLHLRKVYIDDDTFHHIISRCPLIIIETMFIQSCEGLRNIKVNNLRHLKKFYYYKIHSAKDELCSNIEIHPPSLESIEIKNGNLKFHGVDFLNLNHLKLFGVTSSLDHLSLCKFPMLKDLTIGHCDGLKEIELFIDAPKLSWFTYQGAFVPSISFAAISEKWISFISLTYMHTNGTPYSWFLELNKLLKSLRKSERISLTITVQYQINDEDLIQENVNLVQDNGRDKPIVERLSLLCHSSSVISSLLNGTSSICRPRIIGGLGLKRDWETIECLWKILMERESDDQFKNAPWLQDLEEVSMEIYAGLDRNEWHPVTLSELHQETGNNLIRFALKWRENYDPSNQRSQEN